MPSPTPSQCHWLEESRPSSLATLPGSQHLCAPTAPLEAAVMLTTHGPAGDRAPPARAGPVLINRGSRAPHGGRHAQWNFAQRTAAPGEATVGTLPGTRLPSPATARPDRGKVGQFSLPAQAALRPTGPGLGPQKEPGDSGGGPARRGSRPKQDAAGVARPPKLGASGEQHPLPDSVSPPCQMRRTTPAPARTGAGTGAAGPAPRRTLGRTDGHGRGPHSLLPGCTRTESHLSQQLQDSLTSQPLLLPAGRPRSTAFTSAGPPPPEAALCSCAPSRAPAAATESRPLRRPGARAAPAWAGMRAAARAVPEGGPHPSQGPRPLPAEPWGEVDAPCRC